MKYIEKSIVGHIFFDKGTARRVFTLILRDQRFSQIQAQICSDGSTDFFQLP